MGIELIEIVAKMRKGLIFTIQGCFRSVCNHPFLVGMLCFVIILYRSSPLIFSLLVSASPIVICTALLLGILLSYGQPNFPEMDKTFHKAVLLKEGVPKDDIGVHGNDNFYIERFAETRKEITEKLTEKASFSDDAAPLICEGSRDIDSRNDEVWDENIDLADRCEQKAEWNEGRFSDVEIVENHYASISKVNADDLESDDERSDGDSFDSERVNVDSLDSPPQSPWKRLEEGEEEQEEEEHEEEDDEALDSGSDGAESSSPDASITDIMPMLDELHPLLDEDAPHTAQVSNYGSDEEMSSSKSSTVSSSHDSDDEMDNHEEGLEVGGEEDNEDEEDAQGDKEEQTKSAITWTDEDQKNLMDLGSSELERNQRLENLILRRRAKKSIVQERNLIDLESFDLPFNIAPISTNRQNPFDLPHDSFYDNLGLPPIPGSAPSILLPRRNPFDIPYDSSEEKPNLLGDGIPEAFTKSQSRDQPFFRRHESFNVGPSIFAPNRHDFKFHPYFVPERMVPEESGYSPFQRQSSGLSDSKVSSVPETESTGSVEDLEERRLVEEGSQRELESIPIINVVINEDNLSVDPGFISEKEEVTEEDEPQEVEPISLIEHVSEHVGHGSQSSEGEQEYVDDHVDKRYNRDSSSSSLSELSERVFTETEGEGSHIFEERRDGFIAEDHIFSTETFVESSDLRITTASIDDIHGGPVYDTSPTSVTKDCSSSSIFSDVPAESDLNLLPVLVKRMVSFAERESEGSSRETGEDSSSILILPEASKSNLLDEKASESIGVDNTQESDRLVDQLTCFDENNHVLVESSEKQNQDESAMNTYSVVDVNGRTSEGRFTVEHSIESSQSPNSDSDIYMEAYEKLISTTPSAVEGNATSFFYDKLMHGPMFEHLNEVQAPNDEVRIAQALNMPEVQEIDQLASSINSPLSPDFISVPSTVSPTSHADMQTIIEETEEIDEGILSELDCVGDFSSRQWTSSSVGESSSSAQTRIHRVAVEEIDIYEDDMESSISEMQTSERCIEEHIDISDKEFNERDGQDSPDLGASSEDDSPSNIVEPMSINSAINGNHVQAELTLEGQVEIDNSSFGMPELEAQAIEEDIEEIEKTSDMLVATMPEPGTQTIQDSDLGIKQVGEMDVERHELRMIKSTNKTPILEVTETSSDLHEAEPTEKTILSPGNLNVKSCADKSVDEVKSPDDVNSTKEKGETSTERKVKKSTKGEGKKSKSSSSSSSSSSDSSSSDSDKE